MIADNKLTQPSRPQEGHYLIRPLVGEYYLVVLLNCEAARTLLYRMDVCKRIDTYGFRRMEFEVGEYRTKWLSPSEVPDQALRYFDADDHLRVIRFSIPDDCGVFASYTLERISPECVVWSDWWAEYTAEYAESNALPREELIRVANSDISKESLFHGGSW